MPDHALLAVLILLVVAAAVLAVSKRLALGSILGLLAAGVIVGPSGLDITDKVHELREFGEFGVVLLLFLIGLEMQPQKLWSLRRMVFGLGTLQVVGTGLAIAAYAAFFVGSPAEALLVGLGLALSSTAFVVPILQERGKMDTEFGRTAFAILLLQDLAIVPLMALVPLLAGQNRPPLLQRLVEVGGALGVLVVFGRYLVPATLARLKRHSNDEAFAAIVLASVVGAAWLMLQVRLSMALGAFVMGMLLSGSPLRHDVVGIVEPFKSWLISLFFVSVGMATDLHVLVAGGLWTAVHLAAMLAIKALALFGLCLAFRVPPAGAAGVALLLSQAGEFGFVLFGAAQSEGILNDYAFAQGALLISLSMAATPLLAKLADAIEQRGR